MPSAVAAEHPRLVIHNLHKSYAAPVLNGIDLSLAPGEVHALVGANGAGKTTLARIASGLVPPGRGDMTLDGMAYAPGSKHDAEKLGVQIVQQELNLIGTLTVAENLCFGQLPSRRGFIDRETLRATAREALARVGLDSLDPDRETSELGVGVQQLVEIARALQRRSRVLILDEPTAALDASQIETLFANIRRLAHADTAILYISHRLEELHRIADRATVLRDGRVAASDALSQLDRETIVRAMVGSAVEQIALRPPGERGEPALRVEGLGVGTRVRDVSFVVHRGEIFGISGLIGAGRTRLLRGIFGAEPVVAGGVGLGPEDSLRRFRSPTEATHAGVAMIPEDRKRDGLLLPRSIRLNVTLAVLKGARWLAPDRERRLTERALEKLDVKRESILQPVIELSGGNQQKVVVARWLLRDSSILLFDEPTRGIDVAARATLYGLLHQLAHAGKAIVVASSDLDELTALCDRIGVMSRGRLVDIFDRGAWSREALIGAALE